MSETGVTRAALLGALLLAGAACTSYDHEMPDDFDEVVENDVSPGSVGIAVLLDGHGYNHAPALREYLIENGIEDVSLVASSVAPVDVVVDGDMGLIERVDWQPPGLGALPPLSMVGYPGAWTGWHGTDANLALLREGVPVDSFEVERDGEYASGTILLVYYWGGWGDLTPEKTAQPAYEMVLYRLKALAAAGEEE